MIKIPRPNLKRIRNLIVALLFIALQLPLTPLAAGRVSAQAQDVCPEGSGWVKVDGLSSLTYTYTVPSGFEVVQNCYKASNTVVYGTGNVVTSAVFNSPQGVTCTAVGVPHGGCALQNLSHASFLLRSLNTEVTPAAVTFNDVCGTEDDTFTIPTTTGVTYQISGSPVSAGTHAGTGSVTVTAVADTGYVLAVGATAQWSYTFTNVACEEENTEVTPAAVTFNDVCGTEDDTFTIPTTTGVTYQISGSPVSAGTHAGTGSVTVTAVADTGYVLAVGATAQWSYTFTDEACPVVPDRVTICHRTNSNVNPYVKITVDVNAVDGVAGNSGGQPDHYGEHQGPIWNSTLKSLGIEWGDIIPPVTGFHAGFNWTTEGQAIYNNDCVPADLPEPALPTVVARLVPCVPDSGNNDTVTVTVTNTDDDTDETVTYTVVLGGQTQTITLADGASGTLTFSGLSIGSYSAQVTGNDGTQTNSNTVTVGNCPEEGDILGETIVGSRGGGAAVLADTGSDIIGTLFAALALIGLTAGLAVPTMKAQYE